MLNKNNESQLNESVFNNKSLNDSLSEKPSKMSLKEKDIVRRIGKSLVSSKIITKEEN